MQVAGADATAKEPIATPTTVRRDDNLQSPIGDIDVTIASRRTRLSDHGISACTPRATVHKTCLAVVAHLAHCLSAVTINVQPDGPMLVVHN